MVNRLRTELPAITYGFINLVAIFFVNYFSDLPVWVGNWESKALKIASLQNPLDNFYPPGGAILLVPFLGFKPHYQIAVFFYFTVSAILYFMICKKMIKNLKFFYLALLSFTGNPYLLWLVNSSQDTVFELFLIMCGFSLILTRKYILAFFPIYMLCLTRPAYWVSFLILPFLIVVLKIKNNKNLLVSKKIILVPIFFLVATFSINQLMFKSLSLAGEAGMTAHFGHNKYWYLSMPKFDSDVFLSTGGNMDTNRLLNGNTKFTYVENSEFRAALINIYENPKSLFLNTLQKIDTYFFSVQKNPQLSGEFYLSDNQKSIVIGKERNSWLLIFGSYLYFFNRAMILIFSICAATMLYILPKFRREFFGQPNVLFCAPYLFGSISAILFFTESRYKIVSELVLVPLVLSIFDDFKKYRSKNYSSI